VFNFQHKNIYQPKSVRVFLCRFYRVNTTLANTEILTSHLIIHTKDQLVFIVTIRDSLQLVGQNLEPKTDNYNNNKNWGFPKGGNSYLRAGTKEWDRINKISHGNGVSVL